MSQYAAPKKLVQGFFNPYAGMGPPDCCYCAPTGVQTNIYNTSSVTNVSEEEQEAEQVSINVQVNAAVQATIPGLSSLAFMTNTEDAMRTLERGRIEQANRKQLYAAGVAEMGHGPYFYGKADEQKYVP